MADPDPPDGSHHTTLRLVQAIRGGDSGAFNQFFERFEARLLGYLRSQMSAQLRAATTSEDVLQETYLRAFRGFARLAPAAQGATFAWLATIGRHVLTDLYRRHTAERRGGGAVESLDARAAAPDGESALVDRGAEGPSTILDRDFLGREILAALDRLTDDHREVLVLRHLEGLSADETGRRMGRSANAVRLLAARAVDALAHGVGKRRA